MRVQRAGWGGVVVVAMALMSAAVAAAQPAAGRPSVVTLGGAAEVSRAPGSGWSRVVLRDELAEGAAVRTLVGGRLTLLTPAGHAVRLAPFSQVAVERVAPEPPVLRVRHLGGAVWVAVAAGGGAAAAVEVQAGPAVVAVPAGGVGITLVRESRLTVRVYHGRAVIRGSQGGREWERALRAGQEATVAAEGAPAEVAVLRRPPTEAAWVTWNEDQDMAGGYGEAPRER